MRWAAAGRVSDCSELSSPTRNGAQERQMSVREGEEGDNSSACPSVWNILI